MTASTTDDLASAERRIQELTKELSLVRGEVAEGRDQHAATAGILAALSSSRADLRRVCAEIAANAARLCDAYDATIFQVDGDILRRVANYGSIPTNDTLPLTREIVTGRAVFDKQIIHIVDLQSGSEEYPAGRDIALRFGLRTVLAVPLMRASAAIGVVMIRRREVRQFSEKQISLLRTFADQAVIAIENTRLFEAEQARTRELSEALEQQTATGEILGVISHSPTELQPVLDTLVQSATRFCVRMT
jgi:two-component system, NtrC family, sensor kinase